MGEEKKIPIKINRTMTVYVDDPEKIPEIRKKFKKYIDQDYLDELSSKDKEDSDSPFKKDHVELEEDEDTED